MGFFDKIKQGLKKTRDSFGSLFGGLFSGRRVDEALMEELEEALILADLGVACTARVMDTLRARLREERVETSEETREILKSILKDIVRGSGEPLALDTKPSFILVIGVNGVGKTTTIGKIAAGLTADGKKVLLGAADTFRAAAADQLAIWAERAGALLVRKDEGADPASVVYDAIRTGVAEGADVIICDTAGRLHNKANLMGELSKIHRVAERELPDAAREVLLVIDATTGQNALSQANEFKHVAGVTGVVLTKLDGTAKGGIAIAVAGEHGLPIRYIGVGEAADDLMPFDADAFIDALF